MFTFDLKILKGMHLGRNLYLKERIELSCGSCLLRLLSFLCLVVQLYIHDWKSLRLVVMV